MTTVISDRWPVIGKIRSRLLALAGYCLLITGYCFAFELPKEAVYPRVFTPNGDGINDVVVFHVANPSLDTLEGRIFDTQGAFVADIPFNTGFTRGSWDGRDGNGNAARAGVYIFKISSSGKNVTGTVVVAK